MQHKGSDLQDIKERIVKLAEQGAPRPHYCTDEGLWFNRLTSKTSHHYCKEFRSDIDDIRPDWLASTFHWSDERISTLKALISEGLTYSQISKQLGCTRSAVAGKLKRMKDKEQI